MKLEFSVLALASIVSLVSRPSEATMVWSATSTISSVEVLNDGSFFIQLTAGVGATCTQANAIYVQAGQATMTAAGVTAQLASAEAALIAGRSVSILYDNSTAYCYGGYFLLK